MGLDYSQKRLVSAPLRGGRKSAKHRRLELYAFYTGLMSTFLSLVTVVLEALKGR